MPAGMTAGASITPRAARQEWRRRFTPSWADCLSLASCPLSYRMLAHSPGLMDMESQQGNELRVPSQSP
jgi:hypothetical protein